MQLAFELATHLALEPGEGGGHLPLTLHEGHFSGTEVGPVTGGSGEFRDASGEVAIKFFSDTEADITFTLDD